MQRVPEAAPPSYPPWARPVLLCGVGLRLEGFGVLLALVLGIKAVQVGVGLGFQVLGTFSFGGMVVEELGVEAAALRDLSDFQCLSEN